MAVLGAYVFVYLYRWEWNRALFAGVLFVAAEVALGLARVCSTSCDGWEPAPIPGVLARITRRRPAPSAPSPGCRRKTGDQSACSSRC